MDCGHLKLALTAVQWAIRLLHAHQRRLWHTTHWPSGSRHWTVHTMDSIAGKSPHLQYMWIHIYHT